ncbi:MAG: hypothetical protein JO269_10005 [Burkholderiaceae bacterium]|nr:hypothetical protein [Burkholderiaceae bacterium]
MATDTDMVPESKKNHVWRKVVWRTDADERPLGPHHSAEVYCCEEVNGYAVWYVRRLAREDGVGNPATENADYLLGYYAKDKRDEAIERAVLVSNSHSTAADILLTLDELAKTAQKI